MATIVKRLRHIPIGSWCLDDHLEAADLIEELVEALGIVDRGIAGGHMEDQTILSTNGNKMTPLSEIISAVLTKARKQCP